MQRVRAHGVGLALLWLEDLRELPGAAEVIEDLMTLTDRASKVLAAG